MNMKTAKSGDKFGVCVMAFLKHKKENVSFILQKGFPLPTFRGGNCEWNIIEGDEHGFVFHNSKERIYYTQQGNKKCCATGDWGVLGSEEKIALSVGQDVPTEYSKHILVNKSELKWEM